MLKLANLSLFLLSFVVVFVGSTGVLMAQAQTPIATPRVINRIIRATVTPAPTVEPMPTETPEQKITLTENTQGPLEQLIHNQELGSVWFNPIKHAIKSSVEKGVPANTIVLLLLLPLVAAVIAATRHLIGIRGFGIFLPAALSVVFVATGPFVGLGLFALITFVSLVVRLVLKKLKLRLQYLPRMAFLLWAVSLSVLGLLFISPLINYKEFTGVSIFPVLLLALLTEDFTRVQLGKSFRTAFNLTSETLILALVSYLVLTFQPIQRFALLNPEILLLAVALVDFVLGRYSGLRLLEMIRFKKLLSK